MADKKGGKKLIWVLIIAVIIIIISIIKAANAPEYPDINSPRPFTGKEDSEVVVVEFSDLECPACRAAHPVFKRIILEYKDRVRFEFKHFPLRSIHPNAQRAAEGAECANDQGKFWEFVDYAYASNSLGTSDLKGIANELELNAGNFSACLGSRAKKDIVDDNYAEALMLGLMGTPMFIVDGIVAEDWSYESLKSEIDAALAEK